MGEAGHIQETGGVDLPLHGLEVLRGRVVDVAREVVGTLVGGTVLNRVGGGPVYNPQDQMARIQEALNRARAGRVG